MKKTKVKLKIADVLIGIESDFPLEEMSNEERKARASQRYDNFFSRDNKAPEIRIDVKIVRKLPEIKNSRKLFITYHFQDRSENWRLLKKGKNYIYKSPLRGKKQLMVVNSDFDKVRAYLLPKKNKGMVWDSTDLIYDFLQVLLINYFAKNKLGVFTHSIGIKDTDNSGIIFNGKSGAGKSTLARIWHNNSEAMVLNDDRVIVRRNKGRFFIYGSPWHGEFSDYLDSRIDSAALKKIFFIHHAKRNYAQKLSLNSAFSLFIPAIFPAFWQKDLLHNILSLCQDIIKDTDVYSLGFKNNKKIIDFTRKI